MATSDEYNLLKSQRDLLFDGLKKLVRSESTPENIKIYLNQLGKKVVSLKSKVSTTQTLKPFKVGDTVITINNKICRYRIENIYEEKNVSLCTLKTIWVKDNIAPVEGLHHNIPLDFLKHYNGV